MPQIFHRSFNVISKVVIFGAVLILAAIIWMAYEVTWSPYSTEVGLAVDQPVQFSHEHHAGLLGIDCRYCHTSVTQSSFAGLPSTKTCMNCHSQIWVNSPMLRPVRESYETNTPIAWNRVNNVRDFCYFTHASHVNKGVGCTTCHGAIDHMPLTWKSSSLYMKWCLDCHREPERFIRPRDEVFNMQWQPPPDQLERGRRLVEEYNVHAYTHCSTCHR